MISDETNALTGETVIAAKKLTTIKTVIQTGFADLLLKNELKLVIDLQSEFG